ncbi:GCN5-like N-acetyltransferase [Peptoclostridium acidaminophilum DSM 3953]|uniref:GCN5-like N-acetyltransferase n=2 Tax=Peptoclostridium acidaminophilum TaxID=1731 RepID=W8THI9_PEPAC|nr:GCN5-like N-acetyltransferase [Peptoclostridium acidaminophilum DSM 3953]
MNSMSKLSGENFECFPLEWDTEYFGVKSARVILKGIVSEEEQDNILEYCKESDFTTISNVGNLKHNNYWIGRKSDVFLSDLNIQFTKRINGEPEFIDEFTEVHNAYQRNEQVVNIARSAFQYSRFFNDPALPREQAQNIYVHWTKCAFEQTDKYFVITKRNDEVAGYLLFSIDKANSIATIELIAVDEQFRGQRVGKSLISGLESYIHKKGIENIKVGTQVDNVTATQFYIACGFQYVSCSSVYHLWMDRENDDK